MSGVEMEPGDIGLAVIGGTIPPDSEPVYELGWASGTPHCEVCGRFALYLLPGERIDTTRDRLRVASVPGVPYSAAYCEDCLGAGAHPYWILVANVAACGGIGHVHDGVIEMVKRTLDHLGKTMEEFKCDVEADIANLDSYMANDRASEELGKLDDDLGF